MTIQVERLAKADEAFEESKQQCLDWLDDHAQQFGVVWDIDPFVLRAHRDGQVIGILHGYINLSWLHVALLAIDPVARRGGVGKALMDQAENIAREQDCVGIWLDTYDFQGPDYYPHLGFTEYGRLEDFPPGRTRIFFQKRL